jgi:hypothetical protein
MRLYAALFLLCFGMNTAYAQSTQSDECAAFSDEDVAKVTSMAANLMSKPPQGPEGMKEVKRDAMKLDMSALRGKAQASATASKSCCEKRGSSCCEHGDSACCKRKIARGDTDSAFVSPSYPLDGTTKTMEGRCKRKGG